MEDVFCPILNGPILDLYNEVKRLATLESRSSSEQRTLDYKKILAAELVNFARRMNFNIAHFKPI
jgi:hypothetical protein